MPNIKPEEKDKVEVVVRVRYGSPMTLPAVIDRAVPNKPDLYDVHIDSDPTLHAVIDIKNYVWKHTNQQWCLKRADGTDLPGNIKLVSVLGGPSFEIAKATPTELD